MKKQEH